MAIRRASGEVAVRGTAALRPTANASSFIDLFAPNYARPSHELLSHPSMATPDEFVLFSTADAPKATLELPLGIAHKAQLPADIGLILTPQWVVLDFSARDFDDTELEKVWELAETLAGGR